MKTLTPYVPDGCTSLRFSPRSPHTPAPGCLFPGGLVRWLPLKTLRLECELSSLPGLSKQEAGTSCARAGDTKVLRAAPSLAAPGHPAPNAPRPCKPLQQHPSPSTPRGCAPSPARTNGLLGPPHCCRAPSYAGQPQQFARSALAACEGLSG